MGLDVESSGAGDVVPPGLWFLLGFRVCDGPVERDNSTHVLLWSRGWCHIWEDDHDGLAVRGHPRSTLRRRSG